MAVEDMVEGYARVRGLSAREMLNVLTAFLDEQGLNRELDAFLRARKAPRAPGLDACGACGAAMESVPDTLGPGGDGYTELNRCRNGHAWTAHYEASRVERDVRSDVSPEQAARLFEE